MADRTTRIEVGIRVTDAMARENGWLKRRRRLAITNRARRADRRSRRQTTATRFRAATDR